MTTQIEHEIEETYVEMTYLDALMQGQIEEMERDERVIFMGEDPTIYGSARLLDRFGESRVWSMPISEGSFTGVGVGAAITGLRPIVDLTIANFVYLASDQIINQAAKLRYMTGGQVNVPIVFRTSMYYTIGNAAQHSDRPYPMFLNVPGLKVISPATPADAKGLVKSAVRDDDPVMLFEDTTLWNLKGPVPADPYSLVPIGKARIVVEGDDVTIVAAAGAMVPALEAVNALRAEGISVELIDLRTLKPLDTGTIIESVTRTGHLVLVENAHRVASVGAEVAAVVTEEAFEVLKGPVLRLAAPDVPVPFSPSLEAVMYPQTAQIVAAVKQLLCRLTASQDTRKRP